MVLVLPPLLLLLLLVLVLVLVHARKTEGRGP